MRRLPLERITVSYQWTHLLMCVLVIRIFREALQAYR